MKNSLWNPSYLAFRLSSGHYRAYGIHSPFLYSFLEKVLWPKQSTTARPEKFNRFEYKYGSVWQRLITQYPGKVELPDEYPDGWGFLSVFSHPHAHSHPDSLNPKFYHRLVFTSRGREEVFKPLNYDETGFLVLPGIHNLASQALVWEQMKKAPEVGICIDLFHLGIGICRHGLQKESFSINF